MKSKVFEIENTEHPDFKALRSLPSPSRYKRGDVLVLFGELFSRGYANGIVDQAQAAGMTIVRTTVGRRDSDDRLRSLNDEELQAIPSPIINIPLEAGFDLEPCEQDGTTPVDQIRSVKMSAWHEARLDWDKVESSKNRARKRFEANTKQVIAQIENLIPQGANVLFVHTMAGGVPRAKVIMPVMNKVFKGIGDRHIPSDELWRSDLGKLSAMNFNEVTADTFSVLLQATSQLKNRVESNGGQVRYVAYGYHGTEVLIGNRMKWQTYSPYVQGWAKIRLEEHCKKAWQQGIKACVYNCPEILTNSSSIFQGVEVSLYPFIKALQMASGQLPRVKNLLNECQNLLKDGIDFAKIHDYTSRYLESPLIRSHCRFEAWPQHNQKDQMELMLKSSDELIGFHKDEKALMTAVLSEEIFKTTGYIMFRDSFQPQAPVQWLGHDILAQASALI